MQILLSHYFSKMNIVLVETCPFMGPLIPQFWTSGDVSSGFQSLGGQPYSQLAEVYMMYVPSDSPLV